MSIIELKKVSKFYYNKSNISSGFSKVNLKLDIGEFVVITGESGSGKSTLLNVISGLDSYEEGEMFINNEETSHYSETDYETYRRKYIGNIFQNFNLINSYTVFQNIELVMLLDGYKKKEVKQKVLDIIDKVGLSKYKNTKASKLSGGQKQRVAIARALIKETPIIVADEPTGNLDAESAKGVMKLLSKISKDRLVIIVTHNYEQVKDYATRKIVMMDGSIVEDKKLKEVEIKKPLERNYKSITELNKLLLGFRNTFNIKTKFILLLLVYLSLTGLVFSSYPALKKAKSENVTSSNNYLFREYSKKRIILNKIDKSEITDDDINSIKKLKEVNKVVKDDIFLDTTATLESDTFGFEGTLESYENIKKVDKGRLPENENEIVVSGSKDDYNIRTGEIFNKKVKLTIYNDTIKDDISVVGVIYNKNRNNFDSKLYINNNIIEKALRKSYITYGTKEITFDNKVYRNDSETFSYIIKSIDKLKEGELLIPESYNSFCSNYECKNKNASIKVTNTYYKETVNLKVKDYFNDKTYEKLTGISKKEYEDNQMTFYISNIDYDKLYNKGSYQISIFTNKVKDVNKVSKELNKMGYNTYPFKKFSVNAVGDVLGMINLFRKVVFIISIVVLFFISYFIIKMILKSRNIYYSTIRILGTTRKTCKSLLQIELLNDEVIAYFIFLIIIKLCKIKVININTINEIIKYLNVKDYIVLFIILIVMSYLISARYSRSLFKRSTLETYREEI